ncbi:MAG: heme-binding domain-containing protein [Bacteroidota bacterium]
MKNWSLKKKILLGLLALLVFAQFFRVDQTNPTFDASNDFLDMEHAPEDMAVLIKAACYDCHSYETKYPWYFNVSPISLWLKGHVDFGRENLNFSDWGNYTPEKKAHKMEESIEEVERKEMPMTSYTLTHADARLTDEQRIAMADYFRTIASGKNHEGHSH